MSIVPGGDYHLHILMTITYDAFVSYSRRDEALVKPVVSLLALGKRRIFWDEQIEPGARWMDSIAGALAGSGTVVIIWCCHSAESRYVDAEIQAALAQQKTIVPILICHLPIREPLDEIQGVDFREVTGHACIADHPAGDPSGQVAARQFVRHDFAPESPDSATAVEVWLASLKPSAPKAVAVGAAAGAALVAIPFLPALAIVGLLGAGAAGWAGGFFRGAPIDRASLELAAVIETAIRRAERSHR